LDRYSLPAQRVPVDRGSTAQKGSGQIPGNPGINKPEHGTVFSKIRENEKIKRDNNNKKLGKGEGGETERI